MGYDLNYAGVIFGRETCYNPATGTIGIDPKNYFDTNGKKGIADPESLKAYIVNIYKNRMVRGIREEAAGSNCYIQQFQLFSTK